MRLAMANAEVGDDVFGEDPTVNALERRAAELLGREAALFVPSGTMGNQIAIAVHTRPGDEVICESHSHVIDFEMSAMAVLAGVVPRTVAGRDGGRLAWDDVRAAVRENSPHNARTGLVAVENTHNMAGGTVMSVATCRAIGDGARALGIPVHLDGARVFNAATALGVSAAEVAEPFDSVMFCLSKGLSAPVGSMLAGSRQFIEQALVVRRMYGGAMRQVGVLAAAGLVALDEMTGRLADDHRNAQVLARCVCEAAGDAVDPETVQTNIVMIELGDRKMTAMELEDRLRERGVLAMAFGPRRLRLVTHKDVTRADCETAAAVVGELLRR